LKARVADGYLFCKNPLFSGIRKLNSLKEQKAEKVLFVYFKMDSCKEHTWQL